MQNVQISQHLLEPHYGEGRLTMNSEMFSILEKALDRAEKKDKMPRKPCHTSISDKKVLANLRLSSEYENYKKDNLINEVDILMNNDKNFVYGEIVKLSTLGVKELKRLWREKNGLEPPSHMKKSTLVERLAYFLQEQAFGKLPEEDRQQLEVYAQRFEKGEPLIPPVCELAHGMILTREYNGRKHSVKILESEKVEYNGKVYSSLSAVAREITGTRWNGLKFFHVKSR
jgi:hypothetical protein